MRQNRVKRKIRSGEPAYGVWLGDPSPGRIEFYGRLGFDFVLIDTEHLTIRVESLLHLVRACEVSDLVPIVRPPDHERSTILSYLEAGALGLYFPHVQTADDAKAVVDRVKFAPMGSRSAATARPSGYGLAESAADYYRAANDETLIALLIEDVVGLKNLDAILKVDGVDVVCIGPSDLSNSMGYVGQRSHPEVRRVILEAESRIAAAGLTFDCEPETAKDAQDAIARGARLVPFFENPMLAKLFGGILNELRPRPDGLLARS